jgi:hypothetical protein
MPLSGDQTAPFLRFLDAFPQRDAPHDVEAARDAWGRAIQRADPDAIIAGAEAYRVARQGQPARFTLSARRWLQEGRWRDVGPASRPSSTPPPAMVWVACGSPEWREWTRYRGRSPPLDRRGGWHFPSRWPPAPIAAE